MVNLRKGRYAARIAENRVDLACAQSLRFRSFRAKSGEDGCDADQFDATCTHVLIEDQTSGALACCFRLMPISSGDRIGQTYSAQYYDLSALSGFQGKMAELGRFCIDPRFAGDPDVLRLAWGAMTKFVDKEGIELLFGCSSFAGVETQSYLDAFAMLKERHLAPSRWRPLAKAPNVFRFARRLRRKPDARQAMLTMPPLLRTYLLMGGWVSDHAVVDRELNTLHVFTGLEISAIPPTRKKLLRSVAA